MKAISYGLILLIKPLREPLCPGRLPGRDHVHQNKNVFLEDKDQSGDC